MNPNQLAALRKLSSHALTTIDLTDSELRAIRSLVRKGLAYDYADFYRRRTPTHLRIWGISPSGKATLHQLDQTPTFTKNPAKLDLLGVETMGIPHPGKLPKDLSKYLNTATPYSSPFNEQPQKTSTAEFYTGTKYRLRSPQPPAELKLIYPHRFKKDKEEP